MSKKVLRLAISVALVDDSAQRALRVEFDAGAIAEWALGLCLLNNGLVDSLRVSDKHAKFSLELQTSNLLATSQRAEATWAENQLRLELTKTETEYWTHFFLRYFRDGYGEVDHLDLEVIPRDSSETPTFVTLKVPYAAPPLSPDEARRRLGL